MMENKHMALVVGASRGIGRQVAIDLAKNGHAVVVAAKSTSDAQKVTHFPPDPNSPRSTISTVERQIVEAGGHAVSIAVDTRDYESVEILVRKTIEAYGGLDVLVYNSGAIWWASVEDTPMKRFQLMQRVNPEGLYGTIQAALPHLKKHRRGRIIVVSPPIYSRFFRGKTAHAMGKVGMSVLTKGLAMDFERECLTDMAITSIWPAVASNRIRRNEKDDREESRRSSRPAKGKYIFRRILEMLKAPASRVNGGLELDEDFLRNVAGVTDFSKYSVVPGSSPRRIIPVELPDLRVKEQENEGKRMNSAADRSNL